MIWLAIYVVGYVVSFFVGGLIQGGNNVEHGLMSAYFLLIWPVIVPFFALVWLRIKFTRFMRNYMDERELKLADKENEKRLHSARIEPTRYPPTPQTNYREMNCKECGSEIGDRGKVKIVPLQEALKLPKVKSNE